MLPRLVTYNTYMRSFQDKILNNFLFLNKKQLNKQIFEIETVKLLVKNPSEKWVWLGGYHIFFVFVFVFFAFFAFVVTVVAVVVVAVCLFLCFSWLIFLSSLTFLIFL